MDVLEFQLKSVGYIIYAVAKSQVVDCYYYTGQDGYRESMPPEEDRIMEARKNLDTLIKNLDDDMWPILYQQMILHGSLTELEAELRVREIDVHSNRATRDEGKLVQVMRAVVKQKYNTALSLLKIKFQRCADSQKLQAEGVTQQDVMQSISEEIMSGAQDWFRGAPLGNPFRFVQKMNSSTADILISKFPQIYDQASEADMAILDVLTSQLGKYLSDFTLSSTQIKYQPDELQSLYTIMLENKQACTQSSADDLQRLVDRQTLRYLLEKTAVYMDQFVSGQMPGAIAPQKIKAVMGTNRQQHLQESVLLLAGKQLEAYDGKGNLAKDLTTNADQMEYAAARAFGMSSQKVAGMRSAPGSRFTGAGGMSDQFKDMQSQIKNMAGGPFTSLKDVLTSTRSDGDYYTISDPQASRQLSFLLSVIVACGRIRFDAVSETDYETTPSEDIFWLLAAKRLATLIHNKTAAEQIVQHADNIMYLSIVANVDRLTKATGGDKMKLDMIQRTTQRAELLIGQVISSISFIQLESQFGQGEYYQETLDSAYKALAIQNREEIDVEKRKMRRKIAHSAVSYLK